MRLMIVVSAVAALAGCAQAPEDVAPSFVSLDTYQNQTCDQLDRERLTLRVRAAEASARQTKARANDTIGVLLIGLPTASMSGQDEAKSLAQIKGQQRAVADVAAAKGCPAVSTP